MCQHILYNTCIAKADKKTKKKTNVNQRWLSWLPDKNHCRTDKMTTCIGSCVTDEVQLEGCPRMKGNTERISTAKYL